MKIIQTKGIIYFNELGNSSGWYWGTDYAGGDLYEAEELFRDGHEISSNRLVFLHYPDGSTAEPIKAKAGQYFGSPVFYQGQVYLLMVDFPAETILIFRWKPDTDIVNHVTELPLSSAIDCYNLSLRAGKELMLLREGGSGPFQIIWPEKAQFSIGEQEGFEFRDGDRLYFSRWEEDPEYREEVVIRQFPTGKLLEVLPGSLQEFPAGQHWLLR